MENFPENLTPAMVDGISNFNLCVFLMGLEGWRRGLELALYHNMNEYTTMRTQKKSRFGRSYSLKNGDKIHYFYQSRGDKISNTAVKIAQSKQLTKRYLKQGRIATLPSIQFNSSHTDEDIINKASNIEYPIILKPTYGTLSKGVILNIKSKDEFRAALRQVRGKLGYKSIIVERYFEGDDIRLYVVKDQVVAAVRRIPAKVTGDGKKTIDKLIDIKNKSRIMNPYLNARKIKKNKETRKILHKQGYELDDILEKNKTILVKNKSTMSQGVDLYDITDTISNQVKEMAIQTIRSMPDMDHGSVDMLYDGNRSYVLEVNASANISLHMFPTEGKPRNVMAAIIDYYFPETIGKANIHNNMYFDYLDIVEVLKKNYTNYIKVRPLCEEPIIAKEFQLSGEINYKRYSNWVMRQATDQELYGFIQKFDEDSVKVIIASKTEDKLLDFKKFLMDGPRKTIINEIIMYDWNKEVNNGFQIR